MPEKKKSLSDIPKSVVLFVRSPNTIRTIRKLGNLNCRHNIYYRPSMPRSTFSNSVKVLNWHENWRRLIGSADKSFYCL